jgi:hypothetical protein
MRHLLKISFAIVYLCCYRHAEGQQRVLFSSYDCREHIEEINDVAPVESMVFFDTTLLSQEEPEARIAIDTTEGWKNWSFVENYSFGKDRGSLPMITDLRALHPYFRDRITQLINICKTKGIDLAVVETYRTHAKQHEYKTMGKKYTSSGAGRSKHQYGLAIDLVPIVDSVAVWDNLALWRKVGIAGEKLGLSWGGRWKKPFDPGHFEWAGGLSSAHLSSGTLPTIPTHEHYPCMEEDLKLLRKYWVEWETSQSSLTRK